MTFLSQLFRKQPTSQTSNLMRETLFGDMPMDQWPLETASENEFPWNRFVSARQAMLAGYEDAAIAEWKAVVEFPDLEPRHYLQAWEFLRQNGQQPPPETAKQVMGVVVEVPMKRGLDLLAAYKDYSARFWNSSGAGLVWDRPNDILDKPIADLLQASQDMVNIIGPWDQPRLPAPPVGNVRISFLTPSGIHFGEGPMGNMATRPPGNTVMKPALRLLKAIVDISKTLPKQGERI